MSLTVPAPSGPPATQGSGAGANIKNLKGRSKAAVLLVSIGADKAAEVFNHLRPEEIETLSLEMAKLNNLDPMVASSVLEETVATITAFDSLLVGGVDYARDVLEKSVGADRADDIIARLANIIEKRPFEVLRKTPAEQIAAFLHNEAPQTVALVIANLPTPTAAAVLGHLPERDQAEIALRIARMGETSPEIVRMVEEVVRAKLASVSQQEFSSAGGVKSLAQILNNSDRTTERVVLESLTETDEELAAEVRRLLFVFEDIVKLDDRSVQLVLREADQKDLALALRGVSDEVKRRILKNMSERGAQMLLDEISFQPPQRKRVVEEAQGRIVSIVRRLEESGALVLARGGSGENSDDAVV